MMIAFVNDTLAPAELCRLLSQTVPEAYHVPMIFTSRKSDYLATLGPRSYPLGHTDNSQIVINLGQIWSNVVLHSAPGQGATEAQLWYRLLSVCYHEFGHIATIGEQESSGSYRDDLRAYCRAENLANQWANRQILDLAAHDARLAQPRTIGGYCGARLAQLKASYREWGAKNGWGAAKVRSLKDWRCYKTGGQLSAGDVIWRLGLWDYENPYGWLRRASGGLGVVYTDGAGRKHRFYHWGDLLILAERLTALVEAGRIKCKAPAMSWMFR